MLFLSLGEQEIKIGICGRVLLCSWFCVVNLVKMPKIDQPCSQDMGVFIMFMGSYDCVDIKIAMREGYFPGTLFGGFLGAWMTFKKAEMAKILRNGLSMFETNPLNHKWLDFAI